MNTVDTFLIFKRKPILDNWRKCYLDRKVILSRYTPIGHKAKSVERDTRKACLHILMLMHLNGKAIVSQKREYYAAFAKEYPKLKYLSHKTCVSLTHYLSHNRICRWYKGNKLYESGGYLKDYGDASTPGFTSTLVPNEPTQWFEEYFFERNYPELRYDDKPTDKVSYCEETAYLNDMYIRYGFHQNLDLEPLLRIFRDHLQAGGRFYNKLINQKKKIRRAHLGLGTYEHDIKSAHINFCYKIIGESFNGSDAYTDIALDLGYEGAELKHIRNIMKIPALVVLNTTKAKATKKVTSDLVQLGMLYKKAIRKYDREQLEYMLNMSDKTFSKEGRMFMFNNMMIYGKELHRLHEHITILRERWKRTEIRTSHKLFTAEEFINSYKKIHHKIQHLFFNEHLGKQLIHLESKIMYNIAKILDQQYKIGSFIVHDCIYVQSKKDITSLIETIIDKYITILIQLDKIYYITEEYIKIDIPITLFYYRESIRPSNGYKNIDIYDHCYDSS